MKTKFFIGCVLCMGLVATLSHAQTTNTISYRYDGSGNRKFRGTVSIPANGRTADTSSVKKPVADSVKTANYQIKVYPNPTLGELYVDVAGLESDKSTSYQVVDLKGITITDGKVTSQTVIGLSGKSSGIYLLKVFIGKDEYEWKVIKEN